MCYVFVESVSGSILTLMTYVCSLVRLEIVFFLSFGVLGKGSRGFTVSTFSHSRIQLKLVFFRGLVT